MSIELERLEEPPEGAPELEGVGWWLATQSTPNGVMRIAVGCPEELEGDPSFDHVGQVCAEALRAFEGLAAETAARQ